MRILHLTSHLQAGGITTYVTQLAEACSARGHRVTVASGGGAVESVLAARGIAHWRVPLNTSAEVSVSVVRSYQALLRRLDGEPIELVHAHTRVAQVVAYGLWRRRRIPYVATWHGFYRRRVSRRLLPAAGMLTIAISEPVARHLQDVFRVPQERIRLIPHGIDVARFKQPVDPTAQAACRDQWHLPSGCRVVGTVARLVEDKGVAGLLEAFARIRAAIPDARLLIIGDGPERPRLESLSRRLGIAEAVCLTGSVADTRAALSLMEVFVFLPARREGFGLSLLEAMACSRPIVAVRQGGGAAWVLEESRVGVLVEPDAPGQLAEAVVKVLSDPPAARQLGESARAVVKARYDLARTIPQVEAVYEECLALARKSKEGVNG